MRVVHEEYSLRTMPRTLVTVDSARWRRTRIGAARLHAVRSQIREYGWAVVYEPAHSDRQQHAYTVGLGLTLRAPELLTIGLPAAAAQELLNRLGGVLESEGPLAAPADIVGRLAGAGVAVECVPVAEIKSWVEVAVACYEGPAVPGHAWPELAVARVQPLAAVPPNQD